jgi:hypothetical protein
VSFLCANLAPFWQIFMAAVYFVAKETREAQINRRVNKELEGRKCEGDQ